MFLQGCLKNKLSQHCTGFRIWGLGFSGLVSFFPGSLCGKGPFALCFGHVTGPLVDCWLNGSIFNFTKEGNM